ncbi:MAG: ArnT family glycosyltransferase [Candidatus Methylomirabilia bacterium]
MTAAVWAIAGIGLLLRILLAQSTEGTNDVTTWCAFVDAIQQKGILKIYAVTEWVGVPGLRFNHSPPVAWALALFPAIQDLTHLGCSLLIRLPASAADFVTTILVWKLVADQWGTKRALISSALIALNPVLILVSGFHGNTDPVFLSLLVASLLALYRGHIPLAAFCYGMALNVKIVPIILFPFMLLWPSSRRDRLRFGLWAAATVGIGWLPHLLATPVDLLQQIFPYAGWKGAWGLSEIVYGSYQQAPRLALEGMLFAPLILAAGYILARPLPERADPARSLTQLFIILLALTPGFGVQYLAWLVPFLALVSVRLSAAYAALAGSFLYLTYLHWSGGDALGYANVWEVPVKHLWTTAGSVLKWLTWLFLFGLALRALTQIGERLFRGGMAALTPRARLLVLSLAAAFSLAALMTGGLVYFNYQIVYGRLGWSLPEGVFLLNYLFFGALAAGCLGATVALAAGDRLLALFDRLAALSPRSTALIATGATGAIFILITLVRIVLLRDTAVTDDENAYAFMARTLAAGRFYLPSLPEAVRPFFDNPFVINNGKWYGMFFPGHAAALAIGQWINGLRWVPTVAATLTALLAFLVARRIFGQRTALLTVGLLAFSPFFLFSSATLLPHSTVALLLLAFVYSALRAREAPGAARWWLAAGVALGWAALTRPVSAAAFTLPWLVWLALRARGAEGHRRSGGWAILAAVGLVTLAIFSGYNIVLAGAPFLRSYYAFTPHPEYFPAPFPLPQIYELGSTIARLNFWLLGWPLSLVFLPFFRRSAEGVSMLLGGAGVVLGYALTAGPSIDVVGPVQYAELAAPLLMLSASGIDQLVERARGQTGRPRVERFALGAVLGGIVCAAIAFAPIYASSLRAMSALVRAPYDLVRERGLDNAVVFVQSLPAFAAPTGSWVRSHRNNSPDLSDRVLFVRDLGPDKDEELIRYLRDRAPYLMKMEGSELMLVPLEP